MRTKLESGHMHRRHRTMFVIRLPDGRTLSAHREQDALRLAVRASPRSPAAIALGAYPVTRRITRRLEKLGAQVEALGAGDLSARVEVRGADEIADLARSFNRAAAQIEQLVAAQRSTLASASHELRSPLARIRVAIELLGGDEGAELRARVARDIAELDDLIGELLLASRLDALEPGRALDRRETIDLLGARRRGGVAAARASVDGEPVEPGRRSHAAAPAGAQPDRERASTRKRVGRRALGREARARPRAHLRLGSRPRRSRERARAHLRAVLPARGRERSRATAASVSASRWCDRSRATTAASARCLARDGRRNHRSKSISEVSHDGVVRPTTPA